MSANKEEYQEDPRKEVLNRAPLLHAIIEAKLPAAGVWPVEIVEQQQSLIDDFRDTSPDGWMVFKNSARRMFESHMFSPGVTEQTKQEAGILIGLLGYQESNVAMFVKEITGSMLRLGIFNKTLMYDHSPQRRDAMNTAVGRMIQLGGDMKQFISGQKEAAKDRPSNLSQIAVFQENVVVYDQVSAGDK